MNSAERREARYQRRKAARMKKKAAALREYGDFETVFSFERLVETSIVSWRGHMKRFHSYHMEQSVERLYRELFKGG